jgi:uncharacterized sulfatase
VPPGRVVREPVSIVDIMPTVLALAGAPVPAGVEGKVLLGDGAAPSGHRGPVVAELYRDTSLNLQLAVREGQHKLVQSLKVPRVELYDLDRDPGETAPAGLGPDRLAALRGEMAGWLGAAWPTYVRHGAPAQLALDAEQVKALRALGYLE